MMRRPVQIALNEEHNWFNFIRNIPVGRLAQQMALSVFLVALYTFLVTYIQHEYFSQKFTISATVHSLLGVTLGLLLVIRTNTAYDRFWEGRKLVGSLVNGCRNLAIKVRTFTPDSSTKEREKMAAYISSYCYAMKEHLREGVKLEEMVNLSGKKMDRLQQVRHKPNEIAGWMYKESWKMKDKYNLTGEQMLILDKQLEQYTDIIGGCERILKTPLPYAYKMHLKIFIFIYVLTLPFALLHDLIYYTVPAIIMVFYAMVGLEVIAEEIENPFGTDKHDIPMDDICRNITINVHEILAPHLLAEDGTILGREQPAEALAKQDEPKADAYDAAYQQSLRNYKDEE